MITKKPDRCPLSDVSKSERPVVLPVDVSRNIFRTLAGRQPVDNVLVESNSKTNENILFGFPKLTSSQKLKKSTSGESSASESDSSSESDQVILFAIYNI